MKNLLVIFAAITIAISFASCQKELTEAPFVGRWKTIELIEPDHTTINAVDSPWLAGVTFTFFDYHYGRRDNGDSIMPGAPRMMEFIWSKIDETTYHFEDPATKKFNVVSIVIRGDVMTMTETAPQFRQWICKYVGK